MKSFANAILFHNFYAEIYLVDEKNNYLIIKMKLYVKAIMCKQWSLLSCLNCVYCGLKGCVNLENKKTILQEEVFAEIKVSLGSQAPVLSLPRFAARWITHHDSYSVHFYKAWYFCTAYLVAF
jgi:hypothetical protein